MQISKSEKKNFLAPPPSQILGTPLHATLRENFEKMCNLMRLGEYFDQILYYFLFFCKGDIFL